MTASEGNVAKRVNWEGCDGTLCTGFQFPCGKKYNNEYYTRSEAIDEHIAVCRPCRVSVLQSAGLTEDEANDLEDERLTRIALWNDRT